MTNVNDTADESAKPVKGIYLMTDIFGNQRKAKVIPAEKSVKIELLEPAPTRKICESYRPFYEKGSMRLLFGDLRQVYCWNDKEFKVYPQNGLEPLYFAFERQVKK